MLLNSEHAEDFEPALLELDEAEQDAIHDILDRAMSRKETTPAFNEKDDVEEEGKEQKTDRQIAMELEDRHAERLDELRNHIESLEREKGRLRATVEGLERENAELNVQLEELHIEMDEMKKHVTYVENRQSTASAAVSHEAD